MSLTHKQESFCQAIASGSTGSDAYRGAYNADSMSDNAVYREASVMIKTPKISQRVAELKKELADRILWTREMSVKALIKTYKKADQSDNPSAMTSAVKELNAMHGYNEPTRIDHTTNGESLNRPATAEAAAKAFERHNDK